MTPYASTRAGDSLRVAGHMPLYTGRESHANVDREQSGVTVQGRAAQQCSAASVSRSSGRLQLPPQRFIVDGAAHSFRLLVSPHDLIVGPLWLTSPR